MVTDNTSMAWNEPGGGGRKDPWARKDGGPPDLEEVFKRFQEKLFTVFGGSKKDDSDSSKGSTGGGILLILLVAGIIYGALGFYIIKPAENGVITRFGAYNRTVSEGPHWAPKFIESVVVINTGKLSSSRHSGWMLTKDENIIFVEMEVQYRILDPEKYLFSVRDPDRTLKQAADSALRQAIGASTLDGEDDVMTVGKSKVAIDIKQQLSDILASYDIGLFLDTVAFKDPKPPEAVIDAFTDATKSREDEVKFKLRAEAYGNKIIPEAEGYAAKLRLDAEAYKESVILAAQGSTAKFNLVLPEYKKAPGVTKTRLYIDAVEDVLSNVSKVMVDVDSGNNLIYLPIDKLLTTTSVGETRLDSSQDRNVASNRQDKDTGSARSRRRGRG
jgi:modulator of FtsH protease HflK